MGSAERSVVAEYSGAGRGSEGQSGLNSNLMLAQA